MPDVRLIERWLPIAALGIESTRERTPMTPFPAPNRLHVWWARRPLVASRAAILASLLPADADHQKFLRILGIHGDPEIARRAIQKAKRTGIRVANPYGYDRAFNYAPDGEDESWIEGIIPNFRTKIIVDPTAGGGSIPLESMRLGLSSIANDLNAVAAAILYATLDFPQRYNASLISDFEHISKEFRKRIGEAIDWAFPQPDAPDEFAATYLWARTVCCPYCSGTVPLSPNWRLAPDGQGIRLIPKCAAGPGSPGRVCSFQIVKREAEHSEGTVSGGDATCCYPDCRRVIDGDEVKRQAQDGGMGEQLFAVVYKRRIETRLKSGKRGKDKWERGYRPPRVEDDNLLVVQQTLAEKMPEWEARDLVPNERYPQVSNDDRPNQYGMPLWRDQYSPRQLLGHGIATEIFHEMVEQDRRSDKLTELRRAAYVYLSFSLDKLRDYNSRMTRWHSKREVMVNTFDRHDFAFKWSYAEMAIAIEGLGYDWAIEQTAECIKELIELISPGTTVASESLFADRKSALTVPVTITCKPGDALDQIERGIL